MTGQDDQGRRGPRVTRLGSGGWFSPTAAARAGVVLLILVAAYLVWLGLSQPSSARWMSFHLVALLAVGSGLALIRGWLRPGRFRAALEIQSVLICASLAGLLEVLLRRSEPGGGVLLLFAGFTSLAVIDGYFARQCSKGRPNRLRYSAVMALAWVGGVELTAAAWVVLLLGAAVPAVLHRDRLTWVVMAVVALGSVAFIPNPSGGGVLGMLAVANTLALVLLGIEGLHLQDRSRQAERQRELSEASYREIFDSVTEGILVIDIKSGNILQLNRTAALMLGQAGQDWIGSPIRALDPQYSWWPRLLAAPGSVVELAPGTVHGVPLWLETQLLVSELEGQPRGLLVLQDMSRRLQAEQERRRLEEQLLQSQKMEGIGRLAGGIAHDFNNLLTVINGRSELAEALLVEGHPALHEVAEIRRTGLRAAELTSRLLAFSRKQVVELSQVDLNRVIEEIALTLDRIIGEDVELRLQTEPDLFPVRGDAGRLQQVLLNLVVNARDAMPGGGRLVIETANLRVAESRSGSTPPDLPGGRYVRLTVEDTGTGIPEELQDRIFEPFFTTKGVGQGTGLGLSVVHGIVEQHGGRISVSSRTGTGSSFRIFLPAHDGKEIRDVTRDFAKGL